MYLGAACTLPMCVPMPNSKGAPCSLFICLLELNWFKQLSRGRQTKRRHKAEKAALGAGQYAISEKQGKRTLARKEEVCINPKRFITLWSFVFCWFLEYHMCPPLALEHQHPVTWIQYILINIHWPRRLAHVWHCTGLAVRIRRLVFPLYGFAKRLSQQPHQTLDSSDISVHHCSVSCVHFTSQLKE